jgi:uncharacterized membrane protein (DUF2068 family)
MIMNKKYGIWQGIARAIVIILWILSFLTVLNIILIVMALIFGQTSGPSTIGVVSTLGTILTAFLCVIAGFGFWLDRRWGHYLMFLVLMIQVPIVITPAGMLAFYLFLEFHLFLAVQNGVGLGINVLPLILAGLLWASIIKRRVITTSVENHVSDTGYGI